MAEQLADKKCVPCRGGVPPLKGKELNALHKIVPSGVWSTSTTSLAHSPFPISSKRSTS